MQKKKLPVISIIFYVLAIVLIAYAIWAASYSINYISTAIEQNQLIVEGYEFEIASFYMSNIAQYVVFAAILFGIGWILQKMALDKEEVFDFDDDDLDFDDAWEEEIEQEVAEEDLEIEA